MDRSFVDASGPELSSVLRTKANDPTVEGLLVLAAGDGLDRLDAVGRELSVPVFGGVFPAILFEGERYGEGAVVVGLDAAPTTTVVTGLSDPETAIRSQLEESVATPGETTAFVFVDGFADRIGTFVQRLFESYGLECRFIGGGTGTFSDEPGPSVLTDEGLLTDAAVLATVECPSSLGVRHGWQEVDGPFRANHVDGATLSMLGDEPAFDVYRRVVESDADTELTRENFFEVAKSYPFGISRLHEEKIVRDPFTVSADGAITCFGDIPEGEYLHVLTGTSSSLVEAASDATTEAVDDGGGSLLSFDCVSRVRYLEADFEAELDAIGDSEEPAVGALTIGEIANGDGGHLQFYNKTVVVAQFRHL